VAHVLRVVEVEAGDGELDALGGEVEVKGRTLYPRGHHKPHRLSTNRLCWTSGRFCGRHMRQDKTNTEFGGQRIFPAAANGDKRGPECQKSSSLRLASISGIYRVLLYLSGVRHLRILSRYRPVYSS
jgi:hypothetical protein